jgi:phage tail sheath protein FI
MVQVSYPGVYVQEIPSGSRTITGVSTSIAAFVGTAKQGVVSSPVTVLGFTDYVRTFTDDASSGEMTDQVRQFFLNGGQQAIIVRVAHGAQAASVTLNNAAGNAVVVLTSVSKGQAENQLRAAIDYNTAAPERTFNLNVFREVVDANGNATVTASELFKDLSMNPNDPRYFVKAVNQSSQLVTAALDAGNTNTNSGTGSSSGGKMVADIVATVTAALGSNTSGGFRIKLGDDVFRSVSVPNPNGQTAAAFLAALQTAINAQVDPTIGTVTVASVPDGANAFVRITSTGNDVVIEPAASADIAAPLGLGVASGGVEVGTRAANRPIPNGFVSVVGNNLAALLGFAASDKAEWTNTALVLTGPSPFTVPANTVQFPLGTGIMETGTATAGTNSLLNVRQNLQAIASAMTQASKNKWSVQVHGYRVALLPRFGTSTDGALHSFSAGPPEFTALFAGVTAQPGASKLINGSDGTAPTPQDYLDAYTVIDQKVDLFNILILPRSQSDTSNSRADLWPAASDFCLRRRAFLMVDPKPVTTIADILDEILQRRIGIVKDHAAVYWPRIKVNPDGSPRFIDSSGTIAGIMARIDSNRGVWKAPAGLEADLRGVLGVEVAMSDPENGQINPQAVNAIRVFPNGVVSWGARTVDGFDNSGDDDFKYIPVRRFELFIEESLVRGLKFAVFEPNDEPLWAQIRTAVGAFMNNLFRQGAFAGATARDAYFVKVDSETTTQNDINLGIVNVIVGFAPLKPAEFVVISIKQQAGQVQV